jgi:acyl-CoA thioesterase
MKSPKEIIDLMMSKDEFSSLLGIKVIEIKEGECRLSLQITKQLLNGFSIVHGGVTYALADTCLAFVANSFGYKAVSVETSISYLQKGTESDELQAVASCIHKGTKSALFQVNIFNQKNDLLAHFKGTVRISSELW